MVKRLLALSAGAAMLGATTMGALAVDLKDYPGMFVKDGTFDGFFVVGEKAAAVDNLAMTDIAASMKYKKATGASTTTVEGDNWLVQTSSKKFEISNSNASDTSVSGETIRDINTFIGDEELQALVDGKWATNENEYTYQQFLYFDVDGPVPSTSRIVKFTENDGDLTADHLFIANSRQVARYYLEFASTAQSDVTDSTGSSDTTGTYLDDFENTDLKILGKDFTVVQARRPTATIQNSIKLVLMAGATRDTLLEGEAKSYDVKGKSYDATLTFVDTDEAKFTVNGEATNKLKVGETYVLKDKSEIGVSEILYQDYAGGIHSTTFYLGASKLELRDDDIRGSNVTGGYDMKVGSEDIDGALVMVAGTDDNSTVRLSSIALNITSQDDYFVGANAKLSEIMDAAGEESEALFNGGFDIEYKGLSKEDTRFLRLKTSSARRYKLELYDGDGNKVNLPVAYAEADAINISLGEDAQAGSSRANWKKLHLNETRTTSSPSVRADANNIYKDDYFVLTGGTASDGSAKSYLLQYKGADRDTKTSPKIKFKNMGSGETLEYSVSDVGDTATGTIATIKLGGFSFLVENSSATTSDDFQINADFDGSGTVSGLSGATAYIAFVDNYGSQWAFMDSANTNTSNRNDTYTSGIPESFEWTVSVPNGDDYDNIVPAAIRLNITTTTGPELRAALGGLTLLTPDGETEVSYGYTTMGGKLTFREPASDPDEMDLEFPKNQRVPQVYFTSGATTSGTSVAGDMTAVTIVDATKLDSEVASVSAQNLIAVGGPCVNTVAAELLGNPADCTTGFAPGKARIKLFEQTGGKVAMLVAGYSGADTRLAGKVVAHRAGDLSGAEVEVEGTTYSDATISTPTAS